MFSTSCSGDLPLPTSGARASRLLGFSTELRPLQVAPAANRAQTMRLKASMRTAPRRLIVIASFTWLLLGFLTLVSHNRQSRSQQQLQQHQQRTIGKFYIYDWPIEFYWPHPRRFAHHRLFAIASNFENQGFGRVVDRSTRLYHTHQYFLFPIFLHRLLASPQRTQNASLATAFFIPYDIALDSSMRLSDGALYATGCPHVEAVIRQLQESPLFQRANGKDHFLLSGVNHMMWYYLNAPCRRLFAFCENCTKLSIDVYGTELYSQLKSEPYMTQRWVSIPFPSNYHSDYLEPPPTSASRVRKGNDHYMQQRQNLPWRSSQKGANFSEYFESKYQKERPYPICFKGSISVTAKKQQALRRSIIEECTRRGDHQCHLLPLDSHESFAPIFDINGSKARGADLEEYRQCRLCLQPGGDFPTRKGTLDALLSGCLPVTFERAAAHQQWSLHWKQQQEHVIVLLDRDQTMRNITSAFDNLLRLIADAAEMEFRLTAIETIAGRMQYSRPPARYIDQMNDLYRQNISPLAIADVPLLDYDSSIGFTGMHHEDAFDISLNFILSQHNGATL